MFSHSRDTRSEFAVSRGELHAYHPSIMFGPAVLIAFLIRRYQFIHQIALAAITQTSISYLL
jgi:hypothetical protein